MEADPRELKVGHFKWLDRIIYKGIGDLQTDLNETERAMLVKQLATALNRYETLALNMGEVRRSLYKHYNELVEARAATSQLSRDFNMSVKGHNDFVKHRIDRAFGNAFRAEQEADPLAAGFYLKNAGLRHTVLFHPETLKITEAGEATARELYRIRQFQHSLFLSTVKMACGIAKKHNAHLDGNTVEWTDLVQEAIIAAMQAVEAYQPIDEGRTFTSFVYTWVNGIVSKRVNETTRTVPVPRSTLDRFIYVQRAIDQSGLLLTELRGGQWEHGELSEGKLDFNTLAEIADCATLLLKDRGKPFSTEEVKELILNTQDEVSMDMEVEGPESEVVCFGDMLPDESPSIDERIDSELVGSRLMKVIRRLTTDEEYALMELRYGMGSIFGRQRVAEQYNEATGLPMNKGKVADIEERVLVRLQRLAETDSDLHRQLREIWETI